MSKANRAWRILVISTVVASLGGASVPATLAAPGDIFNLGTLGGAYSFGNGINEAGQVTGESQTTGGATSHAFRYTGLPGSGGGAMADLGTLGGTTSQGFGINDAGAVAGISATTGGDAHAFRYSGTPGAGGAMVDLSTLGGTTSIGRGINDAGQVAGYSYTTGDAAFHAFRYTGTPGSGGTMADLGTLGGTYSLGNGINDAGQVAGTSGTIGDVTRAFLYTGTPGSGGAMVDLGTLGGTVSSGYAINDAGQVAGQSSTIGDTADHAFRYSGTPGSGGAMVDLGTLGGTTSFAWDINNAGFVVGNAQRPAGAGFDFWATLWQTDAGNTAVDLDVWLDATNPTQGAYWTLNVFFGVAYGINDNGLITGVGTYDDGPGGLSDGTRAFILDASSLVPEPGALAMLGPVLPTLLIRHARRTRRAARQLPSIICCSGKESPDEAQSIVSAQ